MGALVTLIFVIHLTWLGLVIFGTIWTRGRPFWSAVHLLALVWAIVVEVGPWPCPLTLAEQYFEGRTGLHPNQGSFLLHCVDSVVYPNLPYWVIAVCGVTVCSINLGIYLWRFWVWVRRA
jgi:hypothetical protein